MLELEMIDSKIIKTDTFGDLTIKCVLIDYDYPRAFIAESKNNEVFALVEHSDKLTDFGWNMSKVTLEDINDVNNGDKNFQSLFNKRDLYLVDYSNSDDICIVKKTNEFFGVNEIKGSLYLKGFCDMDELFDYHGFLKAANTTNKKTINYIIEGTKRVVTESVVRAIKYLSDICKNLDHPIDLLRSGFAVQGKSTVLTFTFDDSKDGTIFEGTDNVDENEVGINELGNLLSSNDPYSMISESGKKNDVVLQKLSAFLNNCGKDKINEPKVIIAKPNSNRLSSFSFGKDVVRTRKKAVNDARKIVNNNFTKKVDIITPKGILTDITTKKGNSFGFEELYTKNYYSGIADFNLISREASFEVKGIYLATIEKTTITNNNILKKELYKLLKLERVDNIAISQQTDLFE